MAFFAPSAGAEEAGYAYLDNGEIRLGVDRERGGCIGYFGPASPARNLLNHFDEGRFIQQSWYGDTDGSNWNGTPWRYNPVQGGGWKGEDAEVLAFEQTPEALRITTRPRHWATGKAVPEMTMHSETRLEGPVAHVRFSMQYEGPDHTAVHHQEMPAVFVDAVYAHLVYPENAQGEAPGKLTRRIPGWPNEGGRSPREWIAFLDDQDRGLGVYTPGTSEFTTYRYTGDGKSGPNGSACSYIAPVRALKLTPHLKVSYEVYLTTGTLTEIQDRFEKLRKRRLAPTP